MKKRNINIDEFVYLFCKQTIFSVVKCKELVLRSLSKVKDLCTRRQKKKNMRTDKEKREPIKI